MGKLAFIGQMGERQSECIACVRRAYRSRLELLTFNSLCACCL